MPPLFYWAFLVLSGVLGLSVGSFANVAAYRVPAGLSVVRPRSACPACGTQIKAVDNVPVVSWLLLKGRCRACGAGISLRYPVVEFGTAVLFVVVALRFGLSPTVFAYWVLVAACVVITAVDLEHYRVPVAVLYPSWALGALGLVVASATEGRWGRLLFALAGAAIGFSVLLALHLISPKGMGFGDVRLAGFLGMFLGWLSLVQVAVGLFFGFALGSVVGIALVVVGARTMRSRLPFAPFLCAGAALAILFGREIVRVWLS